MSRQSVILAACHFLDRAEMSVSRRSVQAFLRLNLSKGYSSDEIAPIIAQFKKSGPLEVNPRSDVGPKNKPLERGAGPSTETSGSTHAGVVKVLELEEIEPTAPTLDLGLTPPQSSPPSQPVKPRAPQVDHRSPAEQIADAALSEVRPTIEAALHGMTWTAWKSRNRKAVVDMARSGMTSDEIVAAHAEISEERGTTMMVMAWVQEQIVKRAAAPVSARQAEVDNLPSVANGAKGTAPDDIPPWERPPNHARYVRWSAELEAQWNAQRRQPAMA